MLDVRRRIAEMGLEALGHSRVSRWMPVPAGAAGFVLTLHRVAPSRQDRFDPNAHLSVTPEFLDRLIRCLGSDGWEFASVDEVARPPTDPARARRQIAFSADDGYSDFLRYAVPIFRRRQVPFTLFVVPGFCDRTVAIWWEALARIIGGNDEICLANDGPPALSCRTTAEKRAAFAAWAGWLSHTIEEGRVQAVVRALADAHALDLTALTSELIMTWDDVRALAADPLCTLGAHTMTHAAIARLPRDRAVWEMTESRRRIELETGRRPDLFAFPYGTPGTFGVRDGRIAIECGYRASFTTRPGYVPPDGEWQLLPRISVSGMMQNARFFPALLTPGIWAIRNALRGNPVPVA